MSFLLERPNADFLDLPEAAAEFSHRTCLEKRSVGSEYQNNPFSYLNPMTKNVMFEQILNFDLPHFRHRRQNFPLDQSAFGADGRSCPIVLPI